ncbi:MAG: spore maturation protein, partial [Rothia sp. (in: high G+C Gram-positive bacteria)]|nr:spore maturation protein [Rothia sp. (in: high G+C Gram-positive bacteria)]
MELNYNVTTHLYDAPGTLSERIKNKVIHDLPQRFQPQSTQESVTNAAITTFKRVRPDIVLTVKGDILGRRWWELLNESPVRFGTWMYDEIRRMRYSESDYELLGRIASYSPLDVETLNDRGLGALEVPLAYDAKMPIGRKTCEAVSFVGARYGDREP